MLKSVALIAIFCVLGASEYCSTSSRRYNTHLITDIKFTFNCNYLTIHLKNKKKDPFRQGCNIKVWENPGIYYQASTYIYPCCPTPVDHYSSNLAMRQRFSTIINQHIPNTNLGYPFLLDWRSFSSPHSSS